MKINIRWEWVLIVLMFLVAITLVIVDSAQTQAVYESETFKRCLMAQAWEHPVSDAIKLCEILLQ